MTSISSTGAASSCCHHQAHLLGESVRCRRLELGLSIAEAAELSGLTVWQWAALEHSLWIPEHGPQMRAVADTLQADYGRLAFCALITSMFRPPEVVY